MEIGQYFDEFFKCVQSEVKTIKIVPVKFFTNPNLEIDVRNGAKKVKGIMMKIHQMRWFKEKQFELEFNQLSCFSCINKQCEHFHQLTINYNNAQNKDDAQTDESENLGKNDNNLVSAQIYESENANKFLESQFNVHDWVVVKFMLQEGKAERKWLGKILSMGEDGNFIVTLVRAKHTKNHNGYIHIYIPKCA